MQWSTMLCFPEPHLTCSSPHLLAVKGAVVHHKISCMCPPWLCFWPCYINSDICCSKIILSLPMWVSVGIHIPQQSLLRTYSGNWLHSKMISVLFWHLGGGMAVSAYTFVGSGLIHDCNITSPKTGVFVYWNRLLSLLNLICPSYISLGACRV